MSVFAKSGLVHYTPQDIDRAQLKPSTKAKTESHQLQYIEHTKCVKKTNQGGIKHRKVEEHSARDYASIESDKCTDNIIRIYMSMCPPSVLKMLFT